MNGDVPEETHQAMGAEPRTAHPAAVAHHVVEAPARGVGGLGVGPQFGHDRAQPSGVQLVRPLPGPGVGAVGAGAV